MEGGTRERLQSIAERRWHWIASLNTVRNWLPKSVAVAARGQRRLETSIKPSRLKQARGSCEPELQAQTKLELFKHRRQVRSGSALTPMLRYRAYHTATQPAGNRPVPSSESHPLFKHRMRASGLKELLRNALW